MPQPDDSGVLASSTPPATDLTSESRIDVARIVARSWSASISDAGHRHALAMVLAALDGETDPDELGIDEGPDADAIRRATGPAEQAHDSLAGDDAPTGTPEGAGVVLGRVLVDAAGDLWTQARPDVWQSPEAAGSWSRAGIESRYGPVREVLLVHPEAGRVLDAAAQWQRRRAERGEPGSYSAEQYAEACAALESHLVWLRNLAPAHPVRAVAEHLDAMLAMVGDRPAKPAPKPAPAWNPDPDLEHDPGPRADPKAFGEPVELRLPPAPEPEIAEGLLVDLRDLGESYGPLGVALAAASLTDSVAVVRRLTEPAPGPSGTMLTVPDSPKMVRETLCVAQSAVGWRVDDARRDGHIALLGRLIDECDRHRPLGLDGTHGARHTPTCGCEDKPEPAPKPESHGAAFRGPAAGLNAEPAGDGPGWNRTWLLDCMLPHLPSSSYNEPDLHDEAQRQVTALLADRDDIHASVDRWFTMSRDRLVERNAARAELKHVTAERDRLRGDGIDPASIPEQRAKGWVDFHAEQFCHRCGRPNIWSWFTESELWNQAEGDEGGILCPVCFVADYERVASQQEQITWRIVPENLGDEAKMARHELHKANERLAEARAERDRLQRAVHQGVAAMEELEWLRADHLLIPRGGVKGFRILGHRELISPEGIEIVVRGDLGQESGELERLRAGLATTRQALGDIASLAATAAPADDTTDTIDRLGEIVRLAQEACRPEPAQAEGSGDG